MRTLVGVALAGSLGALARYGVGEVVSARFPDFPWSTLVINVTGSFVLGLLFVLLTERSLASPAVRATLMIGFVGAYTTFSTFSLETMRLVEEGSVLGALLNVGGNLGLGLLAVALGMTLGRVM